MFFKEKEILSSDKKKFFEETLSEIEGIFNPEVFEAKITTNQQEEPVHWISSDEFNRLATKVVMLEKDTADQQRIIVALVNTVKRLAEELAQVKPLLRVATSTVEDLLDQVLSP